MFHVTDISGVGINNDENYENTFIYDIFFQRGKGQKGINYDNPSYQKKISEIIGKPSVSVFHAVIPFDMGWDIGGRADVYFFKKHVDGLIYMTYDLTGKKQKP